MSEVKTLEFINVGRGSLSWKTTIEEPISHKKLLKALKEQTSAVMSRDVDFDYEDATGEGTIYVGGFRPVGSFKITVQQPQPPVPSA